MNTLNLHLGKKVPEVEVCEYSDFRTFDIKTADFATELFFDSDIEIVGFKNAVLWAFQQWERDNA